MKVPRLPSIGINFSEAERSTIPILVAMGTRLVLVHVPMLYIHLYMWILGGTEKTYANSYMDRIPLEFRGYTVMHEENIGKEVLRPGGWTPHVEARSFNMFMGDDFSPYALFVVLQRDEGLDDSHGPERLAGLFIGGDGFATYDALYCQNDGTQAPYLVVLHNSGFHENLPGRDGLLEQIAVRCKVFPEWLLVSTWNTEAWNNYQQAESLPELHGRYLFKMSK